MSIKGWFSKHWFFLKKKINFIIIITFFFFFAKIFTRYFLNTYDSIEEVRSMGQLAQRSTDGPGIGANKPSTVISPLSWKAGRDLQSKAEGTCHWRKTYTLPKFVSTDTRYTPHWEKSEAVELRTNKSYG